MQSLLALAALVVVMVVSLTVQRARAGLEDRQVDNEIDTVALGIATEQLNRAALLPFDEVPRVLNVADLTPPAAFGGATSWEGAADLDDLDGLTRTVPIGPDGRALEYVVRTEVRYVLPAAGDFVSASVQTAHKELTVTVEGPKGQRAVFFRLFGCRFNG